jgi:hypothetical protein
VHFHSSVKPTVQREFKLVRVSNLDPLVKRQSEKSFEAWGWWQGSLPGLLEVLLQILLIHALSV